MVSTSQDMEDSERGRSIKQRRKQGQSQVGTGNLGDGNGELTKRKLPAAPGMEKNLLNPWGGDKG